MTRRAASNRRSIRAFLDSLHGRLLRANARPRQVRSYIRLRADGGNPSSLRPVETDNGQRIRRMRLNAYNGGPMDVGFGLPTVVDLAGMSIPARPIAILRQHDPNRLVGNSTAVHVDGRSIDIDAVCSGVGDDVAEILATDANGFPWQVSIGARILRAAFLDADEKATVNGREITGPAIIVRESRLVEASLVPIGADDSTSATFAAAGGVHASSFVSLEFTKMNFAQWLKSLGLEEASLSAEQLKLLKAKFEAELRAQESGDGDPEPEQEPPVGENDDEASERPRGRRVPRALRAADPTEDEGDEDPQPPRRRRATQPRRDATPADVLAHFRRDLAAEQRRAAAINALPGITPTLAAQAIEQNWPAERAELEILRAGRGQSVPAIHSRDRSQVNVQAIECALSIQAGATVDSLTPDRTRQRTGYTDQIIDQALSAEYRSFRLHALMHEVIRAAGMHHPAGLVNTDFIERAMLADRALQAAGFSNASIPNILGNVMNRVLISSYDAVETVWQYFCAEGNNPDFRPAQRLRLDALGGLQPVAPDGTIAGAQVTDAGYLSQVDTFALLLKLPRKYLLNDDVNAFGEIPGQLGRMCATKVEELFHALLLANTGNFFGTGNANLISGAPSAFSIGGVSLAVQAYQRLVDRNKKPVLSRPDRFLLPTTLQVAGDNLFGSMMINEATAAANANPGKDNPHKGKYKPYTSPYLDNTAITDANGNAFAGQSNSVWYLFGDPQVRAAFRAAFLNGQRRPTIQGAEGLFGELAYQWRCIYDVGMGYEDPIGAVRSNGQ